MKAFSFCCLALYSFLSMAAENPVVEELSGNPVNNQGRLSYTVPLSLPDSIHRIQPSLSLSYSQGSSSRDMGPGFSLGTGSVISRCAPRKHTENRIGGVETGSKSRYCMDGSPLVRTNTRTYRMYEESDHNITITRGSDSSPTQWQVKSKDGYTYTYTRGLRVSRVNQSWVLINKKDVFGNQVDYEYTNNQPQRLLHIRYPGYTVDFLYQESRPQAIELYSNGSPIIIDTLLSHINISTESGDFLYGYVMAYESIPGYKTFSGKRLSAMTKCYDLYGSTCTKPISFNYFDAPNPDNGWAHPDDTTTVIDEDLIASHVDTDGVTGFSSFYSVYLDDQPGLEFCLFSDDKDVLCTNASDDWSTLETYGSGFSVRDDNPHLYFIDINADSHTDVCIPTEEDGVECALNTGIDGQLGIPELWAGSRYSSEQGVQFIDINRDGKPELCGLNEEEDTFECVRNTGTTFANTVLRIRGDFPINRDYQADPFYIEDELGESNLAGYKVKSSHKLFSTGLRDINGDAIPDFCFAEESGYVCRNGVYNDHNLAISNNKTHRLSNVLETIHTTDRKSVATWKKRRNNRRIMSFRPVDINSDGLTDLCYLSDTSLMCHKNTENGFSAAGQYLDLSDIADGFEADNPTEDEYHDFMLHTSSSLHTPDMNGDGYADLCFQYNAGHHCAYNLGDTFSRIERRTSFVSDVGNDSRKTRIFANYMRKVFNERTVYVNFFAMSIYSAPSFTADINGDLKSEYCTRTLEGIDCFSNQHEGLQGLLTGVTTSFGVKTRFEYGNFHSSDMYSIDGSLPEANLVRQEPAAILLKGIETDSGVSNSSGSTIFTQAEFEYQNLIQDITTGFMTYQTVIRKNPEQHRQTESVYAVNGLIAGREVTTIARDEGVKLSETNNHFSVKRLSQGRYRIQVDKVVGDTFDPDSRERLSRSVETFSRYDQYGNARRIIALKQSYGANQETYKVTTDTEYRHLTTPWVLGKPKKTTVEHRLNSEPAIKKVVSFDYYANGSLKQEILEPDNQFSLTTRFFYQDDGTVDYKQLIGKISQSQSQTRTYRYEYDALGRLTYVTDPLNLTKRYEYHDQCPGVTVEKDAADRTVLTNDYDDTTCRLLTTTDYFSNTVTTAIAWSNESLETDDASEESTVLFKITKDSSLKGISTEYNDKLGRALKAVATVAETHANNLTEVAQYTLYNRYGQARARSAPVSVHDGLAVQAEWITQEYDAFGRLAQVTDVGPDKVTRTTTHHYDGFKQTVMAGDYRKETITNIQGNSSFIKEHDKTVQFTYYSNGDLKTTVPNHDAQAKTTLRYDARGNKSRQIDPAVGNWTYQHNAFGELFYQRDGSGNETRISYDNGGRKVGEQLKDDQRYWAYYSSGSAIGQLKHGISSEATRTYQYNQHGQLSVESFTANGQPALHTRYQYADNGQLTSKTLADQSSLPTKLYYGYDKTSNLETVSVDASSLRSYDYQGLQDGLDTAIEQIQRLETEKSKMLKWVKYHENRSTYYSAKADVYEQYLDQGDAIVGDLRRQINSHAKLAKNYLNKYVAFQKVIRQYRSVSQADKYYYKGYDYGARAHKFEYKGGCAKWKRRVLYKRCSRYHYHTFYVESRYFNELSAKTRSGKECAANWPDLRIKKRIGRSTKRVINTKKYSKGKLIKTTKKKIRVRKGRMSWRTYWKRVNHYEWCRTLRYSPSEIFNEISDKYWRLYASKAKYLRYARMSDDKLAQEISRDAQTKRWEIDELNISTRKDYDSSEWRSDRWSYYKNDLSRSLDLYERWGSAYGKRGESADRRASEYEEKAADIESQLSEVEEAKRLLEQQLASLGGRDVLQRGASAQSQLADSGAKLVIWSALSRHRDGSVKTEMFGNGVTTEREYDHSSQTLDSITTLDATGAPISDRFYEYNAQGFVTYKEDIISGAEETFNYRNGQLDNWVRYFDGETVRHDYRYDQHGNLLSKEASQTQFEYRNSSRPFQLTKALGSGVRYDRKGFVTRANGRDYQWNSFGKAKQIRYNGTQTRFQYDASGNRAVRQDSQGTTYYVGGGYELQIDAQGNAIHRIHIQNGYASVATLERYEYVDAMDGELEFDDRPTDHIAYYHQDLLGTGVVVTGSTGEVIRNSGYTPYGKSLSDSMVSQPSAVEQQQTQATEQYAQMLMGYEWDTYQDVLKKIEADQTLSTEDAVLLARAISVRSVTDHLKGFTSHEVLSDSGLTHMNARLYDPELGRFMTPDSLIPDAGKPMAYNRYSYVYNNPATYTDPTGHFVVTLGSAVGYFVASHTWSDSAFHQRLSTTILAAGIAVVAGPHASAAVIAAGTSLVINAALTGHIQGPEVRAAAFAAVSAQFAEEIGHGTGLEGQGWEVKAVSHGVSQGTIGWLRSGDFWGNFTAGVASHAAGAAMDGMGMGNIGGGGGVIIRTTVASTLGGLVAEATGGAFAEGAMTAAVVHLFNQEEVAQKGRGAARADQKRYKAALANTNQKSLVYDGQNVLVVDETNGKVLYSVSATSGTGEGMNNPAMQDAPFVGPIPEGEYSFGSSSWNSQSLPRQVYNIAAGNGDWGAYNVPLTPAVPHSTRDSFYLHGGFFSGSAGCIDAGAQVGRLYNLTSGQENTTLHVRY